MHAKRTAAHDDVLYQDHRACPFPPQLAPPPLAALRKNSLRSCAGSDGLTTPCGLRKTLRHVGKLHALVTRLNSIELGVDPRMVLTQPIEEGYGISAEGLTDLDLQLETVRKAPFF